MTYTVCEANEKGGRILIVGATGFIGGFVAEASLASGRPTYVLARNSSTKNKTIKLLQGKGAIIIHGSIKDQEFMEILLKDRNIEVVISVVGGGSILDQFNLVRAIKAVGTVKRFLPSEFGHDVDRADPVEPGLTLYKEKRKVRRMVEELGIPYTYVCCNSVAAWPYHDNTHPSEGLPPMDQFQIYGHGSVKENLIPESIVASLTRDIFIKGCLTNFIIDGPNDFEASTLYPDTPFKTIDEFFVEFFLSRLPTIDGVVMIVEKPVDDVVNMLTVESYA